MDQPSFKKWIKQEPTRGELMVVFNDLGREENPRAAALGSAIMVEIGLTSVLKARLWIKNDKADDELFDFTGPLGTFSSKIKMAEAMRIIGPATRANFDRIREIRNYFAHTSRPLILLCYKQNNLG
jgi:hypothetical protein